MRSVLSITLLLAMPAQAATKGPFKLNGAYRFTTSEFDSKTMKPVCTETWTFNASKLRVESGEEVVEKQYRTTRNRIGNWLITKALSTNFKPDCTGSVATTLNPEESPIYLLPMKMGDVMVCPPPGRAANGIPMISNCFGTLRKGK